MVTRSGSDAGLFPEEKPRGAWITAYCDGGSRGNPGPAGFGVFVQDEAGQTVGELSEFIGLKTNNVAEYSGLLAALKFALDEGYPRLRVVADSELMVKQIKGQYRVNSPELKPLYEEAKRRISQLESFRIEHVLRDKNRQADMLANRAMDRGSGRTAQVERPARSPQGLQKLEASKSQETVKKPVAPIPIVRAGADRPAEPAARTLRGFVKSGVIHLLDGERLPDGCFVKVIREE